MPELPEVETVRQGLKNLIIGKTVKAVNFDWPKGFPNEKSDIDAFLLNAKIVDVRRRAKVLLIDLSTEHTLVIHLKMTGQLVFVGQKQKEERGQKKSKSNGLRFGAGHPNDSLVGQLPDKSTRITFVFKDNSHLYFNDQRKFGWVKLIESLKVETLPFMQKVGPEPLEPEFTQKVFFERLMRRKNSKIKAVLLDQTTLAGVGNIYADESLWGAKIHPETLVKNLSSVKINKLHSEIIFVLKLAIEKGGSTDRNYVNAEGKKGSYIEFARVFRREKLACPRCGTEIIKIRVAGRGTHLCPKCRGL